MGTAIREEILKQAPDAQVTVASWFMMKPELRQEGDLHLRDEDDYVELVEKGGFDVIYADHCMERMTPKFAEIFVDTCVCRCQASRREQMCVSGICEEAN